MLPISMLAVLLVQLLGSPVVTVCEGGQKERWMCAGSVNVEQLTDVLVGICYGCRAVTGGTLSGGGGVQHNEVYTRSRRYKSPFTRISYRETATTNRYCRTVTGMIFIETLCRAR